jgi:hypothetical protein
MATGMYMVKKKHPTKVELFTFTLGDSDKDCTVDDGLIHSYFYQTEALARRAMKGAMKRAGWPKGAVVKCTLRKIK